jgi:ABC-type dipeptide/oligopeptide/nickel transport system permease component
MLTFLARRLLGTLIVLAIMSFVIFSLIGLMPGDPIETLLELADRGTGRRSGLFAHLQPAGSGNSAAAPG